MAATPGPASGPSRAEQFLDDILAAPAELAAVIATQRAALSALPVGLLGELLARPRRRLFGMGSSRFAATDAAARWRLGGRDAVAETASASGPTPGGPDTLAIAISSSGSTAEVVAAARRHRAAGSHVLALTSRLDAALAAEADTVLPLRAARVETSGIATMSYRATIAGLLTLDRDPALDAAVDLAPAALQAVIGGRADWLTSAAAVLNTGREVHVLADGIHAGIAEQGALMFREAPRIGALWFDTGDWLHVGLYTMLPGDGVLLIGGSPADADAISTIHARGGRVVVVGPECDVADVWIPTNSIAAGSTVTAALAATVVAELLAVAIWSEATPHDRGGRNVPPTR